MRGPMLSNLRSFISFSTRLLAQQKRCVAAAIVFGVLSGAAESAGVALFIPLLSDAVSFDLQGGDKLTRWLIELFAGFPKAQRTMVVAGLMALAIALRGLLGFVTGAAYAEIDRRLSHGLRLDLYRRIVHADYTTWERTASGDLYNTLSAESARVTQSMVGLLSMVVTAIHALLHVALLLLLSVRMTFAVLIAIALLSLPAMAISASTRRLSLLHNRVSSRMTVRLIETFEAMKIIHAYGSGDYEVSRYARLSERLARIGLRLRMLQSALGPTRELGRAALVVGLFACAVLLKLEVGTAVTFLLLLNRLEPKCRELNAYALATDAIHASLIKVQGVLATTTPTMRFGAQHRPPLREAVVFDRVSFSYESASGEAVKDLSMQLRKGELTAIVGPSGAGKSTVLRLLLRLHDPSSGQVSLDNVPLQEFSRESLRERIAYVSQESHLFDASIGYNIAYGSPHATSAAISHAATLAGAHRFISELQEGYGTKVGLRGSKLSGGERQRVLLARALLRKPDILVLDEATSALDTISEDVVKRALHSLKDSCAIVLVSHRFALVEHADTIVVMRAGMIVEQGRFSELVTTGGLFASMHGLQAMERARAANR
jgi:subfamily B ATP-binding cassette protein MsbA